MKFDLLHAAMLRVSDEHDLDPNYYAFWPSKSLHRRNHIESVAHELAHAICIGRIMSSDELGRRIENMSDARADAHELTALRVEVAALRRLGVRVDIVHLPALEAFRGDRPTAAEFRAPLTVAEQAAVGWFLSIVRDAAKETR